MPLGSWPICGLRIRVVAVVPVGFKPLTVLAQQGGFLLCASNGNVKLRVFAHAERGGGKILDYVSNFDVAHWFAIGTADGAGFRAVGQKLQDAHTIVAQRR